MREYCNITLVQQLVNIYTKLSEPVTVQYVFLWAWGSKPKGQSWQPTL